MKGELVQKNGLSGILNKPLVIGELIELKGVEKDIADIKREQIDQNSGIQELDNKITNFDKTVFPSNISTDLNDDFQAIPLVQSRAYNKGKGTEVRNYQNGITRISENTENADEGTSGNGTYIYAVIKDDFAPKYQNYGFSKIIDVVVNIKATNENDTFRAILNERGSWGNGATAYLQIDKLKPGTNVIRFIGNISNPSQNFYKYIIIASNTNSHFSATLSAYLQNDFAKYIKDNINELNDKITNFDKTVFPSNISTDLEYDLQAIPFQHRTIINRGNYTDNDINLLKIYENTQNYEEGTGNSTAISVKIKKEFVPKVVNGKFEKPIDIFVNITSNNENDIYDLFMSSSNNWNPSVSKFAYKTLPSNGFHHIRFTGEEFTDAEDTEFAYILLRNRTYTNNLEASICAFIDNEYAESLEKQIKNMQEDIKIKPKNIDTLFNDDFYALPFRQGNEVNKNKVLSTNYIDNIKKLTLDSSNATAGAGNDCWVNGVINSDFAPKVTNGNVDFPVDIVVNISSENESDTFNVYLNSRGDWVNGANYYFYKTGLKQGINIVRLGIGTKANIPNNTILSYIIVKNNNWNNFKASISAYRANDALYRLENKLIEPSMISDNLNDDFRAIPFKQYDLINKGKIGNFSNSKTKITANTHDIEEGTGTYSYIRFIFDNKFVPEVVNEKFEKPIDVFINIESDNPNQNYRLILSSGADWNPNHSMKEFHPKGNGIHHFRFDGSGHNHYNETKYPYIILTNTNASYNIKASICAYYENNIINDVYNKFDTVNDEIGEINRKIASDKEIVCWGDSLTAGGGWTTRLQVLSGMTVYNGGTGGETAKTIMARQGGDVMLVNNITIPADKTPVLIASRSTDVGIPTYFGNKATPLLQGGSHVNPVKIGDIEGTLRWTGSAYNDQNRNLDVYKN